MKLKSLLLGASAAALMGSSAHAAVNIYVTGSTAYRAPALAAILNFLNNHTVNNVVNGAIVSTVATPASSDLFGASQGIYENSDASIIIETNFTGSAAGLVDLVTANAQTYINPSSVTLSQITIPGLVGNGGTATYGAPVASSTVTLSAVPNVTFSDTYLASVAASVSNSTVSPAITDANGTISKGSQLTTQMLAGFVGHAGSSTVAAKQDAVGIVPFAWFLGNSSSAIKPGITNVTQQAAALLISGPAPVQLFTGSTAVSGNVYLIGRNEDSGTRVEGFAEAQQGYNANPEQFELFFDATGTGFNSGKVTYSTASGQTTSEYFSTTTIPTGGVDKSSPAANVAQVTSANDFEDDAGLYTQAKIAWGLAGHSGYAAGGDVANALLADNNHPDTIAATFDGGGTFSGNAFFMGYLGWADGFGLTNPKNYTSHAVELSYNGVTPSVANIQNGSYTFWGFEHMYYMQSGNTANVLTSSSPTLADINAIADSVFTTYAATNSAGATDATMAENPPVAGILYNTVTVTRTQEGQPIKLK